MNLTVNSEPSGRAAHFLLRLVWYWLPPLLWLGFITYMSTSRFSGQKTAGFLQPLLQWILPFLGQEGIGLIHLLIRKAGHVTEYAVLAVLTLRAFRFGRVERLRAAWLSSTFLLVAVFAFLDEWHQSFYPNRSASILDSLLDIGGGLIGLLIALRFYSSQLTTRLSNREG